VWLTYVDNSKMLYIWLENSLANKINLLIRKKFIAQSKKLVEAICDRQITTAVW